MADRNIKAMIEEGRRLAIADRYRYTLNIDEVAALLEECGINAAQMFDGVLALLDSAYCVGLVSGYRKGKREAARKYRKETIRS